MYGYCKNNNTTKSVSVRDSLICFFFHDKAVNIIWEPETSKVVFTGSVTSSKFPEAEISKETEQETGSVCSLTGRVSTQTYAFEQDTEEGGNKKYICTCTLTDDFLNNQVINNDHSYCTSVEGLSPARACQIDLVCLVLTELLKLFDVCHLGKLWQMFGEATNSLQKLKRLTQNALMAMIICGILSL